MRKVFLLLVLVACTIYVNAQTKDYPAFAQIEALLKKAEGGTYWYSTDKFIINKQTFGYKSVSTTKTKVYGDGEMVYTEEMVYTDIVWPKKIEEKDLSFWNSDRVAHFVIRLDKDYRQAKYTDGKLIWDDSKGKQIIVYYLPEDKEALIELFKKLLK